jgi:aspartate aminotransferase
MSFISKGTDYKMMGKGEPQVDRGYKVGRREIHELPVPHISSIGAYADRLAVEAEARGVTLPPSVRLQIGEPDFRTPEHIRAVAMKSIADESQTYGAVVGHTWLRELLADKIQSVNGYHVKPINTAIAPGGTGAIMAALLATVGVGDEVLYPDPCWPFYPIQIKVSGAKGVAYTLDPENGWLPDMEKLESMVTERTRMLMINTPGNPTGVVFPRKVVQELVSFAQRHNLYLLADECYDQIVFEGEHVSPGELLSYNEFEHGRFIGIYTFSKTYAMTGWRIGYVVAGTQLLKTISDVLNVSFTNISTFVQRAAAEALQGPQDCVVEMRESYRRRRDLVVGLLKEAGRYRYTPEGAFYALIDVHYKGGRARRGQQFAFELLRERNIVVTPGEDFGQVADHAIRVSLAASERDLDYGVREICAFADASSPRDA